MSEISQLMLLFVLRYFVFVCCSLIRARLRPTKTKTVDLCLEPMHWLSAMDIVVVTRLLSRKLHISPSDDDETRSHSQTVDGPREGQGWRGGPRGRPQPGRVGRMHGSVTVWSSRAEWHLAATWLRRSQSYCSELQVARQDMSSQTPNARWCHARTLSLRHRRRILQLRLHHKTPTCRIYRVGQKQWTVFESLLFTVK